MSTSPLNYKKNNPGHVLGFTPGNEAEWAVPYSPAFFKLPGEKGTLLTTTSGSPIKRTCLCQSALSVRNQKVRVVSDSC